MPDIFIFSLMWLWTPESGEAKHLADSAESIILPSGSIITIFSTLVGDPVGKHDSNQDRQKSLPMLLCHICYAILAACFKPCQSSHQCLVKEPDSYSFACLSLT